MFSRLLDPPPKYRYICNIYQIWVYKLVWRCFIDNATWCSFHLDADVIPDTRCVYLMEFLDVWLPCIPPLVWVIVPLSCSLYRSSCLSLSFSPSLSLSLSLSFSLSLLLSQMPIADAWKQIKLVLFQCNLDCRSVRPWSSRYCVAAAASVSMQDRWSQGIALPLNLGCRWFSYGYN